MSDPKVQVELTLQEAYALAVLYDQAPDTLSLVHNGTWYGRLADIAMLRIADGIARATDDKTMLLRAGALWARIDQERAHNE